MTHVFRVEKASLLCKLLKLKGLYLLWGRRGAFCAAAAWTTWAGAWKWMESDSCQDLGKPTPAAHTPAAKQSACLRSKSACLRNKRLSAGSFSFWYQGRNGTTEILQTCLRIGRYGRCSVFLAPVAGVRRGKANTNTCSLLCRWPGRWVPRSATSKCRWKRVEEESTTKRALYIRICTKSRLGLFEEDL